MPRKPRSALLKFAPNDHRVGEIDKDGLPEKDIRDGLSAVVVIDSTLWCACDEATRLERLTSSNSHELIYDDHTPFPLRDYLTLHAPEDKEADIEGLDVNGEYLWLVGSHSLKRSNPKRGRDDNFKRLSKVSSDGNRFLLARIPLTNLKQPGGSKTGAAQLHGSAKGNDLIKALIQDRHLGRFLKSLGKDDSELDEDTGIPGKDNGFDIEGLAVSGGRIFMGLRGPVLRGWTAVLELMVAEDNEEPAVLRLQPFESKGQLYRKHFLDLGGLGVRDLCIDGHDLLILAGPTMDLDGPVRIFRWPGGAEPEEESVVFAGTPEDKLQKILDVPFGEGNDHAEGMALLPSSSNNGGASRSVLLLYDAPSDQRKAGRSGEVVLRADVISLT